MKAGIKGLLTVILAATLGLTAMGAKADVVMTLRTQGGIHYFTDAACPDSDSMLSAYFEKDGDNSLRVGCWTANMDLGEMGKIVADYDYYDSPLIYDVKKNINNGWLEFPGE